MIMVKRRTVDTLVAALVGAMPLVLLLWVYDAQVPESAAEDISARIYPDALAYAWLLLSLLAIGEALFSGNQETLEIARRDLLRPGAIVLVVLAGFALLQLIGFLVAAAFYILAFTWMLKERGPAAWGAALLVPVAVYLILLQAFEVRLPSLLDLWR